MNKKKKDELTRKDFLSAFTAGVAAISSIQLLAQNTEIDTSKTIKKQSKSPKSVAIIGAGLSGLYSAYLLDKAGYDVTIIEARQKAGGRIQTYTDPISGLRGELGGEWISEEDTNIKSLSKEVNIDLILRDKDRDLLIGDKYTDSNRIPINKEVRDIIHKVISLYNKMSNEKKQGLDKIDLFNYLKYQGISESELFSLDLHYSLFYGETIRNISAEKGIADLEYYDHIKEKQYRIDGGAEKLINALKDKLFLTPMFFNESVTMIEDSDSSVTITCKSGRKIKADVCIVTVPASVLSSIRFRPDFNKEKKLALLQMRYSRITKLITVYREIDFVKERINVLSDGILKSVYSNGKSITYNRGLLTGIATGDKSEMFARTSESGAIQLVKAAYENIELLSAVQIDKLVYKSWEYEPFSNGAVSYYAPGTFDVKSALKKSLNRVFFAGEHLGTNSGSMESAISSAIDAISSI